VVSAALFVIGLLILVPTGLCVAFFGILGFVEGDLYGFGFILFFAVLPALVGGVLVYTALQSREQP
jgi:hypothetical protein